MADDADIGSEPDDLPEVVTAGVFLPEAKDVAELYLENHRSLGRQGIHLPVDIVTQLAGRATGGGGEVLAG